MLNSIRKVKKKAWIVIGVSAAFVLASAGVVYMDIKSIGEEELATQAAAMQNQAADRRIAQIRNIEDRVLRERYRVGEYVKVLPDDKEINDFVQKISEFSAASGVEITKLDDSAARSRGRKKAASAFEEAAYKLLLDGTLSEFLDFMHRFETHDRFIKVKSFAIKNQQSAAQGEVEGPQRHSIEMTLETYVYNPGKGAQQVDIMNADKRSLALLETEPIADSLELETYDYLPQPERRDPFADPRLKAEVSAENQRIAAQNVEEQKKTLDGLLDRFAAIRKALDEEGLITSFVKKVEFGRQLSDQMAKLAVEIESAHKNATFRDKALAESFQRDLAQPFGVLYGERKKVDERGLAQRELKVELEHMNAAFTAGRYEEVVGSARAIMAAKTAANGEEVAKIFREIEYLAGRAQARVEFASIQLELKGYVFEPDRPERAVVIINDRAYSRGEVLADGVIVGRIDLSRVVFLYKDEEIEKPLD
ncbi:MAG: type 4a pilus biogenesis protein PilO [Planctomycetes bacterium]|nr:type 4a pilus biogenesis protein PilO [Planctomycetota bacterium]